MDTVHGNAALSDTNLYQAIIHHRKKFNQLRGINYASHIPSTINFIPPNTIIHLWEADYRLMRNSMIYGEAKDFTELIKRLNELAERFKKVKFEF